MVENKNDLQFAWYHPIGGNGVFYCNSADYGKTYSSHDSVNGQASAKHPQIAILENGDIIIAWDEIVKKGEKYNSHLRRRSLRGRWAKMT